VIDHDPLCPRPRCDYGIGDPAFACMGYEDCEHDCQCTLIAQVRADERQKAAARITAQCAHTKYEGCAPCTHDQAAAAVRGAQP